MRNATAALVFTALLLLGGSAQAAEREMVVDLLDGTRVQGVLAEIVPGDHCTVVLASGARRVIPWASVERIAAPGTPAPPRPSVPSAPASPPPMPPATTTQGPLVRELPVASPAGASAPVRAPTGDREHDASPPPRPKEGSVDPEETVFVTLHASQRGELQMSKKGQGWETACVAPCNRDLPLDAAYRYVANGRPQLGFRLQSQSSGRSFVDISLRSHAADVVGVTAAVVGTILLYGALIAAGESSRSKGSAGTTLGILGLIGIGTGTILLATNGSSITQSPGPSREGATRDSAVRSPTTEVAALVRRPPTASIFSISF